MARRLHWPAGLRISWGMGQGVGRGHLGNGRVLCASGWLQKEVIVPVRRKLILSTARHKYEDIGS
ncbi:hypothetical protein Mapa_015193 [Marchantia paleacea]|nr:hypothetical protein Mapa_015193 [Marchantia paleacea]